jgi:hypothetical protein
MCEHKSQEELGGRLVVGSLCTFLKLNEAASQNKLKLENNNKDGTAF